MTPDFYASVWHEDLTKIALAAAGGWMAIGNFIMYRMVQFQDLIDGRRLRHPDRRIRRQPAMMVALLVFLAAGDAGVRRHGGGARARGSVKRRAAGIGRVDDGDDRRRRTLAAALQREGRAARCIDYTTKHYSADERRRRSRCCAAG